MKRHNSIIKMTITTKNYEFYALDYLEGNLDATTQEAMDNFLQKHPELQAEMDEMQAIILEAEDDIVFEKKDSLRKEIVLNSGKPRVLPLWFRYAAAAAVIFALIYGTVRMSKQYNDSTPMEMVQEDEYAPKIKHNNKQPMPNKPQKIEEKEVKVEEIAENQIEENQNFNSKESKTSNPVTPENQNLAESDKFVAHTPKEEEKMTPKKEAPILIAEQEIEVIENPTEPQIEERQFSTTAIAAIDPDHQIMTKKIAQKEAVVEMSLLYESQMLVEALNAPKTKKQRKIKTPFGTIKLGEIAEALTPESYFASK